MLTDNITTAPASTIQPAGLDGVFKNVQMVALVLDCVIFMAGTLGNGVVIYVTGCRMKRTVNSVWFLNLALADFLFTAFLIFKIISTSQAHQWQFGQFMCKLFYFVSLVNMFASVFLLAAISLDRCLSIWVVVWAHNKRTVRKAQVICVVIWMTAAACSTPEATFRQLVIGEGTIHCSYFETTPFWSLYMFRFVMGFLIPFLVILLSDVAIGVRTGRMQTTRKQRSRRIIFAIIVAFFICWLPIHIIYIIDLNTLTNPDLQKIVQIGAPLAHSLSFLNSCLNPILYVFMCDEFQKKLKQSICFVLESALAEDNMSFMSSRSLTSHFSRVTRKSDSTAPVERQGTSTSLNSEESKVVITVERERDGEH
ncbi:chemerin-like receptor 1 [Lycodopsis pacificus]